MIMDFTSMHNFTIMNIVCNKWTTINPEMLYRNIHLNDIGLWSIRTEHGHKHTNIMSVLNGFRNYMNAYIYSQILRNKFL